MRESNGGGVTDLPARYREALDDSEQRFLLAWLTVYRDQLDVRDWEKLLGLTPEEREEYTIRILRKLHSRSSTDLITKCLKEMGWWPPVPTAARWLPKSP